MEGVENGDAASKTTGGRPNVQLIGLDQGMQTSREAIRLEIF